jgi:phospholipid transport system substrate-binding protein
MHIPIATGFLTVLATAFISMAQPAFASENTESASQGEELNLAEKEAFAHDFAQQVLAIIQDPKKSFSDRKGILRTAFSNSVDIDWIARFVVGRAWNTASQEQREQYASLYRQYLTETYVANFAENPDRRIRDIKVFGVNENNQEDFTVRTEMMLADMENLKVNYLVNTNGGNYRVRDIAIENVSLISTHRSEFAEITFARGISGIIAELEARLDRLTGKQMALSMIQPEEEQR